MNPTVSDTVEDAASDYEAVLADYRHRQMLEHLTGPLVSLALHVVLVVALMFLLAAKPIEDRVEIEVTMEDMQVKELEPLVLEELQKLEQLAEDIVPTVEKPNVPVEAVDVPMSDDFSENLAQTDDAMDFSDVLDVEVNDTPLKLSTAYGGRTDQGRKRQMHRFGGSNLAEAAVLKALRWLKRTQNADGSWSETKPEAMAGLGLLAFLAHGETPLSDEFGMTVQKAMQYLTDHMMTVSADDPPRDREAPYRHAITVYALAEAYGLTKIPFLKPAMETGLAIIVSGQQESGGYDYHYSKRSERWDLSISAWQIQAMKAGYVAGADVPGLLEALETSVDFLKNRAHKNGEFAYSSATAGGWGMQGAGTLCLQLLGEGQSQEARAGVKNISANDSVVWDNDAEYRVQENPACYWYYETQAMFHAGQAAWRKWNRQFAKVLVENQRSDGHWECPGRMKRRSEFDPCYTTTLCCLSLQVYYRYLPTYKVPKPVARKKEASILDAIDDDLGLSIE